MWNAVSLMMNKAGALTIQILICVLSLTQIPHSNLLHIVQVIVDKKSFPISCWKRCLICQGSGGGNEEDEDDSEGSSGSDDEESSDDDEDEGESSNDDTPLQIDEKKESANPTKYVC